MNDRLRVGIAGCGAPQDVSWLEEWRSVRAAVREGSTALDDLEAARYAWTVIEDAFPRSAP